MKNLGAETGVPYLDVICYREHKEIFRYCSGEKAVGKERLYMYSCGKPITVVTALRLLEEGKLSLDDKVYKFYLKLKMRL